MWQWLRDLDRLLRGEVTQPSALRQGNLEVSGRGLAILVIGLGAIYGLCMGSFGLMNRGTAEAWQQLFATMVKVPVLFFLTLLVTFPSLYVFNALVGSRLSLRALQCLLIATIAVILAVLASFGPIVAFFSLTTPNYGFIALLNVLLYAIAGGLGMYFLLQTLHRLSVASGEPILLHVVEPSVAEPSDASAATPAQPAGMTGALDRLEGQVIGRHVKNVFRIWIIVFALVGARMAWVLRPFIGAPNLPFEWFRARQSNFFEAVWIAFINLFR